MHAEKSSFERVVVVGSCPAERQDAVMAAASLQPNLSIGFVKDAVLTKGKSVEEWEAHVVGQAVAMLSSYDVPHLHVVNISGGKNCLGGLLVRRARLVRSIKTASGQDDVRITIGFVGFDEFIEEFGSRRERTANDNVKGIVTIWHRFKCALGLPRPTDERKTVALAMRRIKYLRF